MLFSIKNHLGPTLLLTVVLAAASLWLHQLLGLRWNLDLSPSLIRSAALGLGAIVGINAGLHLLLRAMFGDGHLATCRRFVNHFRPQGPAHFLAAGLLAAAEEMFFRGVVLEGLWHGIAPGPGWAIAASAGLFGICHLIRERLLGLFFWWAVLEGVMLGVFYASTGSLAVLMLAHAVNDAAGFALFAVERHTGWFLQRGKGS